MAARVNQLRSLSNLVADFAALAGAGQRKFHQCLQYHRIRRAPMHARPSFTALYQAHELMLLRLVATA